MVSTVRQNYSLLRLVEGKGVRVTMGKISGGRVLILMAAVMWSTSGFFAKAPLFADWPLEIDGMPVRGPLLAFWRAAFASLVLLPFVRKPLAGPGN